MAKQYPAGYEETAKDLRTMGFTFQEISDLLKVPVSTAIFWAHHIEPLENGRRPAWLKVSDLLDYLKPGTPLIAIPLPSGLIAWLKEQSKQ